MPWGDGGGFDVAIGETFGLRGANGAGKTTTLECLLGVSRPDAGSVTILGLDPRTRRKELFQRVGVQFQEARYQDKITVDELCRATRALYREADDPATVSYTHLTDPARTFSIHAEGALSYDALLFIPGRAPYDLYSKDFKKGLALYSSNVLIMEQCEELLPAHFNLSLIHI